MSDSLVLVDVELTRLAAVYDRVYVAWFDLGPRRLAARPVHTLLSNSEASGVGGGAGEHARRPVPDGVAQLVAALNASPLASFDLDSAVDGLGRLFAAAGRDPAPWPGVLDLRDLVGDRLGRPRTDTLAAACIALGLRPPHPLAGGGGRLGSALACLAAAGRADTTRALNGLVGIA